MKVDVIKYEVLNKKNVRKPVSRKSGSQIYVFTHKKPHVKLIPVKRFRCVCNPCHPLCLVQPLSLTNPTVSGRLFRPVVVTCTKSIAYLLYF